MHRTKTRAWFTDVESAVWQGKYYSFYGGNMAEEWAEYVVGILSIDANANANSPKKVLNRARMDIAKAHGVTTEQVRISVDL